MYAKFHYYISLVEGDNITLTINVTTNLSTPFNGSVTWKVFSGTEQDLPLTAEVINYIGYEVFHSKLSLYNLSYYNDIGNYTCTVSILIISWGMSLLFVVIYCYQLLLLSKLVSSKHFHFNVSLSCYMLLKSAGQEFGLYDNII